MVICRYQLTCPEITIGATQVLGLRCGMSGQAAVCSHHAEYLPIDLVTVGHTRTALLFINLQ